MNTGRIKWPEPAPAPKNQEPAPPEPAPIEKRRSRGTVWMAAAGAVAIATVAVVTVARRPHAIATAAASAPRAVPPPPPVSPPPAPPPPAPPPPAAPPPVAAPVAAPAPEPPARTAPTAGSYEALVAEGEQAFGRRQLDRALSAFERAAHLRPRGAAAQHGLGRCLVQQGDPKEAADHFREAAQAGLAEAWFDLGEAQRVLAANDDAVASYRKYLGAGGGRRSARARKLIAELAPP